MNLDSSNISDAGLVHLSGLKKSTGRKPKDMKRDLATRAIDLYWYGADRRKCVLRREQLVWRLIDGKARYVHYDCRLSVGRAAKAKKLQTRIRMICRRYGEVLDHAAPDDAKFARESWVSPSKGGLVPVPCSVPEEAR